jgi:UrcA family protein
MTAAPVNSNRRTFGHAAVLAVSLLAGSLGVAQAAPAPQDVPRVVVPYGDLDLSSGEGVRELYKRISAAAREVCPYPNARELGQSMVNRSCRNAAISRAVSEVRSPQLVALRAQHVKRG